MLCTPSLALFTTTFLLPVTVTLCAWAEALRTDDCPSGSESDARGGCRRCPVGFYREAGAQLECHPCPPGWVTREVGAWMESECDLRVGARGDCPSGQEWSSTLENCSPCPVGTYRTKGVDYWCYPCPPGQNTSYPGAMSVDNCVMYDCPSGQEWSSTLGKCSPCPVGTYRTKGIDYWCYPCPPGQNTSYPGAISVDDCVVPVQCVAGTEWNQTTHFCEPCRQGSFRPYHSDMRCQPCPEGHVTLFRGSRARSECVPYGGTDLVLDEEDCPAGTQYEPRLQVCQVCGLGTYRAAADAFTPCVPCPIGTSTFTEGATHPSLCMDREQLARLKSSSRNTVICPHGSEWFAMEEPFWGTLEGCRPCPWGTYRDQRKQGLCNLCPRETSTLMIGAISRDLCVNSSVGESAWTQEEPLSGLGSFSPDSCPPGTSWNQTHMACLLCPQGTYSMTGATCLMCPANTTTLGRGAAYSHQCGLPMYTSQQPFFTGSECPLGSEWDAFSHACRPCPRGWFRESHEASRCFMCPHGLTTLTPGSMSMFLCAVPREVPGRLYIGSDGCEEGYRSEANGTYCVPCERGSYKTQIGHGSCIPCPVGRDGMPLQTLQRGAIDINHCLPSGEVIGVSPSHGPQAGGTLLLVEVDAPIDFRVSSIHVGGHLCKPTANYLVDGVVRCVTAPVRSLPPPAPVSLQAPGGVIFSSPFNFTYNPDPTITKVSRSNAIVSGGMTMTVTGTSLMSVSAPALLLYNTAPSLSTVDVLNWPCEARSETELLCPLQDMSELLSASPPPRRRRDTHQVAPPVSFQTGFSLDGVTYFRNLSDVLPQYGTLIIQPDPVIDTFTDKDGVRLLEVDVLDLKLKGSNLDLALQKDDYSVVVGPCQAEVVSLTADLLTTRLCEDLSTNTRHKVTVSMAGLSEYVGDVTLASVGTVAAVQSRTGEALRIVIPLLVVAAVVILVVIVVVTVHLYRRQRAEKNLDYSPDSSMIATAAQNGHVVDPRLPPLPVNSVFGPERVTVMPGTQGFTTVRSKRDRGVSMRQLALPSGGMSTGGGHTGMSVVEAVEIGNQDLLRFEMDQDDNDYPYPSASSVNQSDISSVHKERPGTSAESDTDSAPGSTPNSIPNSHSSSSYRGRGASSDSAPPASTYKARYKSTRTRPLSSGGVASGDTGPRPPTPPPPPPAPPDLNNLDRY